MKTIYYAIQNIIRGRGSNLTKVLSLTLGLTVGLLLFSQIAFELNYEKCYPESENLAIVRERFTTNHVPNKEWQVYVEGVMAGAIMENFPDKVSSATQYATILLRDLYLNNKKLDARQIYADSLFFETLGIPVLKGNPREDFKVNNVCYLSESYAKEIFGAEDPIGKHLLMEKVRPYTVKGIYKDIASNTSVKQADIIVSLETLNRFLGKPRWKNNQVYCCIVRLKDTDYHDDFNRQLQGMVEKYVSFDLKKNGSYTEFGALPFEEYHWENEDVKQRLMILCLLGFSILFVALMNYVLIAVSNMSRRAKAIGVHKCSGAESGTILSIFMIETGIILVMALLLSIFLMVNCSDIIEDILGTSLSSLFSWSTIGVSLLVVGVVFIVGAFLPGHVYAAIPATQVFRRYTDAKKGWKRSLLFIQFTGVSFILGLLFVTLLQYHKLMSEPLGFKSDGLVTGSLYIDEKTTEHIYEDLKRQPMVEDVTGASATILGGLYWGNNIKGDDGKQLFHTQILHIYPNFPEVVGLELIEGRYPVKDGEAIVNEEFVRKRNWKDGAIGKLINRDCKVVGVCKDYREFGLIEPVAPVLVQALKKSAGILHIRLKEPYDDNQQRLENYFHDTYPLVSFDLKSINQIREDMNKETYRFRNSVMMTSIFIILIVLMGLIGYISDETQRRSKEIAVRKVNGAEASDVLRMLSRNILYVAVPSVFIGTLLSYWIGKVWLEQFAETISLSPLLFIATAIVVLLFIVVCVVVKAWKIANENPVISIKSE